MLEIPYEGAYAPLRGVTMSEAYASSLEISFNVRGGLLMRQMHHWAALLFIGGMMIHMLRVFFTGAYRKPREINWLIGVALLALSLFEGLTGYSLLDDLLSGAGLRITAGVAQSLPIVGTWLTFFLIGGEYPGDDVIGRFYTIPHPAAARCPAGADHRAHDPGRGCSSTPRCTQGTHQRQRGGAGRSTRPSSQVGRVLHVHLRGHRAAGHPSPRSTRSGCSGPTAPSDIGAGSQPDFYLAFLDGSLRLTPGWEINFLGFTLPMSVILPALAPIGLILAGLALYPFAERWITGDSREHHIAERPRENPHRTAIGMAAITFYGVLWLMASNDVISAYFRLSLNVMIVIGRGLVFVGPALAYYITYRICLGLQRRDAASLGHGVETGVIQRMPTGEYVEVHVPPNEAVEARIRGKEPIPVISPASGVTGETSRRLRRRRPGGGVR
ncbi:hypothetical protein GCM10017559_64990 [Streptosporangium longisporum]|uniref:Cytochrome bc1 complex cytochrome b subunit n=2 Tax=Streptosporangium longisporum TaxID=46187 RepID=A0ABP6L3H4_9ACTN